MFAYLDTENLVTHRTCQNFIEGRNCRAWFCCFPCRGTGELLRNDSRHWNSYSLL